MKPREARLKHATIAFRALDFLLTVGLRPARTSPNPRHLAVGWLSGLRVRECVLCTYSYASGRLADWLALLRVRAYVRCSCRFTKVKRLSC